MGKFRDLTGMKFGKLTVVSREKNVKRCVMWKCLCECGNVVTVRADSLSGGNTKSCGCLKSKVYKATDHSHFKHKGTGTRLYRIWRSMKCRCYLPSHKYYDIYGGRGITICEEWKNDYATFRNWAEKNGYAEDMSIDRIDNDKGYCPENCRFIYYKDQPKNRRTNHIIEVNGEKMTIAECSRKYGVPESTIAFRANRGADVLKRERRW